MGAHNFEQYCRGNSMKEAYKGAVEDARHEYGHNPYNGTISTTGSFKDKTSAFKSSGKTLDQYIEATLDNTVKWEYCFGVCTQEPESTKPGEYVFWGWAAC